MARALVMIVIGLFLAGCGKHYWEAPGRSVTEFQTDSGQCIQESKTKYEVSERIYRRCMQAQGWMRVQTQYQAPANSEALRRKRSSTRHRILLVSGGSHRGAQSILASHRLVFPGPNAYPGAVSGQTVSVVGNGEAGAGGRGVDGACEPRRPQRSTRMRFREIGIALRFGSREPGGTG